MTDAVWYLAHPISADKQFTAQQNMDHVVKLCGILLNRSIKVVAPYHTHLLCLDDNNETHRKIGLETDCAVARALGRIVLTGHKLSDGMKAELAACPTAIIVNLIGMPDSMMTDYIIMKLFGLGSNQEGFRMMQLGMQQGAGSSRAL